MTATKSGDGATAWQRAMHAAIGFFLNHGAPIIFAGLLWYVLWWGHSPQIEAADAAMWHVSWVGVIALAYVALQARAVLAQPRGGVTHSMIEILVSLLPLFVVIYAFVDWMRGQSALSVFQVIVMVQATMATLIDVIIFTWFSLRLSRLSIQTMDLHHR